MRYALREALAAFRRSPALTGLSASMIALSLLVVGLFGIAAYNIQRVLERIEERVEVVAYLRDDADYRAVRAAQNEIDGMPEVRETRYITREQALEIAKQELPEFRNLFGGTDGNPLPASIEIALKPGQHGPEAIKRFVDRVSQYRFVEDVRYGQDWLDTLYLLRRVAGAATLLLGGAFALVAALIIGAAVRMAIFARRDEIAIMRLVGATDAFIRRPFVIEGLITGIVGAVLAIIATYMIFGMISDSMLELQWLPDLHVLGIVAAGGALGALASTVAVHRHLREI